MAKQRTLTRKLTQAVTIARDDTQPEATALIARSIIEIADGFRRALSAGLTRDTLVTLIHAHTGPECGKPAIRETLRVAAELDKLCLERNR